MVAVGFAVISPECKAALSFDSEKGRLIATGRADHVGRPRNLRAVIPFAAWSELVDQFKAHQTALDATTQVLRSRRRAAYLFFAFMCARARLLTEIREAGVPIGPRLTADLLAYHGL
jgi:hypothetical protein